MNGVLYLAMGKKHYEEALVSIESLRAWNDLPITVITNMGREGDFDTIPLAESGYSPAYKIRAAKMSPYDKTLMLDTDTYIAGELDVFDALDRFDIAAVFQPNRYNWPTSEPVPACFPEFNSGVLVYEKCSVVDDLLDDWLVRWEKTEARGDQGAFREAVYFSQARICTLPPEYNYRFCQDSCVSRKVQIIHGDASVDKFRQIRRRANTHGSQRILRFMDVYG